MVGLARQSCAGLKRAFGAEYDYSTLAGALTDAWKLREHVRATEAEAMRVLQAATDAFRDAQARAASLRRRAAETAVQRDALQAKVTAARAEAEAASAAATAAASKGKAGAASKAGAGATSASAGAKGGAAAKGSTAATAAAATSSSSPASSPRNTEESIVALQREHAAMASRVSELQSQAEVAEADAAQLEGRAREAMEAQERSRVSPEDARKLALIDAALKFDLKALRALLNLPDTVPFDTTL